MGRFNYLLSLIIVVFLAVVNSGPAQAQGSAKNQPKLGPGESLQTLRFVLQKNLVVPNQVAVQEGWCRLLIADPLMVASKQNVELRDANDVPLASDQLGDHASHTEMYYRLTPGRTKLHVGTGNQWVIQIDVAAKAGKAAGHQEN